MTGDGTEYMKSIIEGTDCGGFVNAGGSRLLGLDIDDIDPNGF